MQLFSRKTALFALSLGAMTALGACGDDVTVTPAPDAPVVVSITPPSATMNIGETISFAVQITGGSTTAAPTLSSCSSSNAAVATAAAASGKCNVTAVASGNVTVTAVSSTGGQAAASVTVNAATAAIKDLSASPTTASIAVGQSITIVPNVTRGSAAITPAYTYATSSASIASVSGAVVTAVAPGTATITVTATGSGTGFTTTTLTTGVTITVTAAPAAITSLTVQPTSLANPAMALGSTAQLTSSTTAAAGVTPTITYTTQTASVATVSAAGLVTAVGPGTSAITVVASAPGTATLAAASLTVVVPVIVSPAANVTIASVTQGPVTSSGSANNDGIVFAANAQVNQPVDIANTRDQIQVTLNLQPNGQSLSSVRVYICDAAGNNCGDPAAEQTYAGSAANASMVQLSINTADFTSNFTAGTATTKYANGQHVIKASVRTTVGTESFNATNNQGVLNFTNVDGWAAQFVAPSATATRTTAGVSYNYFGGPGATGTGTIRPVAVFYTPLRTIQSASVGLTTCGTPKQYTATPFTTTYSNATVAAATNLTCGGYEQANNLNAQSLPTITAAQDNSNNSAPTVSTGIGYRTSASVTAPVAIRLDYAGPTFAVANPALKWASGVLNNFNWRTNTSAPADGGVGPNTTATFSYTYSGCGATAVAMPTAGAADIPECATDFTADVYTVAGTGLDLLANSTTVSTAATPNRFAIDNVAPLIRYTVAASGSGSSAVAATPGQGPGSFADTTTFSASTLALTGFAVTAVPAATDTIWGTDALDERSGLTTALNILARANQANSTGVCQRGAAFPTGGTIGSAFITNPACVFTGLSPFLQFGTAMSDGYRPLQARILGSDFGIGGTPVEGYYSYAARVGDRAGNIATTPVRRVLFNNSTPAMTGLGIPSTVTAAGPNTFTPNFTEVVEAWVTNLAIGYGAASASALLDPTGATRATLTFPATLYNARFNDAIGLNGNFTTATPFTSGVNIYTNLEYAATSGAVNNASQSRPDSAYARVINAGGNVSLGNAGAGGFFGVALLSGNVGNDATSWNTFNVNVLTWGLGTIASQWNAPANGVKAIVSATTNQINSPFTRVDFYEYQTAAPTVIGAAAGQWVFIGMVDATSSPCVSAAATCPVYIADNGTTRVWTYRLTTRTNGVNGLAAGTTLTTLTAVGTTRFMAIASNGTKGRGLATNPAAAMSQIQ